MTDPGAGEAAPGAPGPEPAADGSASRSAEGSESPAADDSDSPAAAGDRPGTTADGVDGETAGAGAGAGQGEEVEPVEVLVKLAEDGEIEPWDIDIVAVTDAFLEELEERDLRTSGRALFYASVLLRMKGDELLAEDDEEQEAPEPEPWERALEDGPMAAPEAGAPGDGEGPPGFDPVDALEAEMDRRLERKRARGSPETLDELVRELREAERDSWWKCSREYDTDDSPRGFRRGTQTLDYRAGDDRRAEGEPGEAEVTDTTHDEDMEATVAEVRGALRSRYDGGREEVLFREVRGAADTPVRTYLALLFLANRGIVGLRQDELFGDLWIRDRAAPAAGDEAVAD